MRADILRVAQYFSEPRRSEGKTRAIEQNVPTYYMLSHRIRDLLFQTFGQKTFETWILQCNK